MSRIQIAPNSTYFEKDRKPFFLMADTCWSAFTNLTPEEWERYLSFRSAQGFNAVQVNILPQWDRGMRPEESLCPFLRPDQRELHLSDIPETYFEHIESYLKKASEYHIVPILVLLWSNYTNGTFFDHLWGHTALAPEDVASYVQKAAERFRAFEPLYFVSGDTDFSDRVVDEYYLPALNALKQTDPEALASLHICGDGFERAEEIRETIPERLLNHKGIDFYVYQSGHQDGWLDRCRNCANAFRSLGVRKPVFNAEPCYEGWNNAYAVHDAGHLRQSIWHSVLSGGDAGLSYGAQGVWQWYREGDFFAPAHKKDAQLLYTCAQPLTGWQAMELEGAADACFVRTVMERHGILDIQPDSRVNGETDLTRLATANGGSSILLYMPRSQKTEVAIPANGWKFTLYDLKHRKEIPAQIRHHANGFSVPCPGTDADMLLVAQQP